MATIIQVGWGKEAKADKNGHDIGPRVGERVFNRVGRLVNSTMSGDQTNYSYITIPFRPSSIF